jgi:hypothetical protein
MRMKKLYPTAAIAIALGATAAIAQELPTFEASGFPITRHQVAVLWSASVQERAPTPTLTLDGIPASPHQVTVLTPRLRITELVGQGQALSPEPKSTNHAPRIIQTVNKGFSVKELCAEQRLLDAEHVHIANEGKPSRPLRRLYPAQGQPWSAGG